MSVSSSRTNGRAWRPGFGVLNDFAMARRLRLLSSTASLPRSMWILLVLGAAGTIMFTWFYEASR